MGVTDFAIGLSELRISQERGEIANNSLESSVLVKEFFGSVWKR